MTALRMTRYATTATALVFGSCLGLPASAVAGATVLAATPNTSCTVQQVMKASDQMDEPWEIAAADPGALTDPQGDQLTGAGVTVAVIDTGIQQQLPQLVVHSGEVLNGEAGTYASDDDGHGTMVASVIAAQKSTANGMQGIAPGVTLMSMREAGCNAPGGNTEDAMADAINDAVKAGAEVINISQDGYDADNSLMAAVAHAYAHGVVVVNSAGNQGDRDTVGTNGTDYGINPKTYPASYEPYVIAVGAVDQYGTAALFSEVGSAKNTYFIGVSAPGVAVGGLEPDGVIGTDDGTSFAAPYVAAEAALIMQEHDWTGPADANAARAYDVMKIIYATASGDGTYDAGLGWGEADIQKALQTPLAAGDDQVAQGTAIGGLTQLRGPGPLADVQTASVNPVGRAVVTPEVAAAVNQSAKNQQRWAYIALGAGLLVAFVALAAAAVARDATRRRGAARH
jgi:subtilisin family serine protease